MTYNEIIDSLRAKLGDSREENDKILREAAEKFAAEKNYEGVQAAGELILENMPEAQRDELKRLTYIDGVRLDVMQKNIVELINKKKFVDAKNLAERLYKKIILEYSESDNNKFVSFRNPFEDNLSQLLFKSDKTLMRTPFDFAEMLTTYAYLIVETGSPLDAIPVLEKAIEYNPVDCGPKFELAEVFKLLKNKKRVIEITRDTLKVASSPIAIARCYANIGYTLTDYREFEDAACFYVASVMFAPNPAIPNELQHLADLKGSPIVRPSQEKIIETMKNYDIEFGPSRDVIALSAQLSAKFLQEKDIPNALNAMKITYNLTLDEKVKELILKLDKNSPLYVPKPESVTDGDETRVNIQKTDNPDAK